MKKEYFLISPILASIGPYFSRLKENSETITNLGNSDIEVPEGTPQVIYDADKNPYLLVVGDNLKEAIRTAEDLGFVVAQGFIKTNLKGLGEVLGFC